MDDTSYEDFQRKLKDFPHSFQLENFQQISREKIQVILNHLQSERESIDYSRSLMEEVRDHNFISFLQFNLRNSESAFQENSKAREKEPDNIVALGNHIHMKYLEGDVELVDEELKNLELMRGNETFKNKIVRAKAELAYSYNRMGPAFLIKSVHAYEEITELGSYPEEVHMLVWKFGAALAFRRYYKRCKRFEKVKYATKARDYLKDITEKSKDPYLLAKSWIEMAENYSLDKSNPESVQQMTEYLDKALHGGSKDAFILERCGKYHRYLGNLEKSKHYLEEAIKIRETTFACEHLALTFQGIAKQAQKNQDSSLETKGFDIYPQCQSMDSGFESEFQHAVTQQPSADSRQLCEQREPSHTSPLKTPKSEETQPAPETSCEDVLQSAESLEPSSSDNTKVHLTETFAKKSGLNPLALPFYPSSHQMYRTRSLTETTATDQQFIHRSHSTEYTQFRHSVDDAPKQSHKYIYIKSPVTPVPLPTDDPNVQMALKYFKKSIEVSDSFNKTAQYELGLLYRSIGEYRKGIEQFKKTCNARTGYTDRQMIVNSYEQIGLCYQNIADTTDDETEKGKLREDGKRMLIKAVEVCALQAADTCKAVASLPTLRSLLLDQQQTDDISNLQELARLHKLVGRHRDSLDFYHILFQENESLINDPQIAVVVMENFLKEKDYQYAAVFLDILMCTEEGKGIAKEMDLINRLHLESALYYMRLNDLLSSRSCFQSAFLYHYDRLAFDKDDVWDVIILNEDDKDVPSSKADHLTKLLVNMCGLEVTRNTDDALGGVPEIQAQTRMIRSSKTVLILLEREELSGILEFSSILAVEMMKRNEARSVVVVTLDKSFVPSWLLALPCQEYRDTQGLVVHDDDRLWLLELFKKLIGVKK